MTEITSIKEKIIEYFKKTDWYDHLKTFLIGEELDSILTKLYNFVQEEKRFTPPLKDVFTAFTKTSFKDVKVVVIGQDPYPQLNVANGVAFCCAKQGKLNPSLKFILNAVNKTVYNGEEQSTDVDLTRWTEQGVLLLNTAFTCEINKPATHYEVWKNFMTYLLDTISTKKEKVVFLLLGAKAHEFESLIDDDKHIVIKASHPASAVYKGGVWECNDCFNKINEHLETKIQW